MTIWIIVGACIVIALICGGIWAAKWKRDRDEEHRRIVRAAEKQVLNKAMGDIVTELEKAGVTFKKK